MLSLVSPQGLAVANLSRMITVLPRMSTGNGLYTSLSSERHLRIHLPGTVPDPGVLCPAQPGVLELEPGLDEVQRMHDHHLDTS